MSARVKSALGAHSEAPLLGLDIAATLLPIQTVGVQGDGRTYSYVCALSSDRCVAGEKPPVTWELVVSMHGAQPTLLAAVIVCPRVFQRQCACFDTL